MKKKVFISITVLCFISTSAFSSERVKSESVGVSLMDESFVVETSEEDATDSLNRVAGTIDKGFISSDSSYRSAHHGRSGPFATHEDAYDVS